MGCCFYLPGDVQGIVRRPTRKHAAAECLHLFNDINEATLRCQRVRKSDKISLITFLRPGGVLLSRDLAVQVPSTPESLTSVFGMGTGVTSPSLPPDFRIVITCALLRRLSAS